VYSQVDACLFDHACERFPDLKNLVEVIAKQAESEFDSEFNLVTLAEMEFKARPQVEAAFTGEMPEETFDQGFNLYDAVDFFLKD
jgi:hypothetical protein